MSLTLSLDKNLKHERDIWLAMALKTNTRFLILHVMPFMFKETSDLFSKFLAIPNLFSVTTTLFKIKILGIQSKLFHSCQAEQNSLQDLPYITKISLSVLSHSHILWILLISKSQAFLWLDYIFPQSFTVRQMLKLYFPHLLKALLFLELWFLYPFLIKTRFLASLKTPTMI